MLKGLRGLYDIGEFIGDVYNKNSMASNIRNRDLCRKYANISLFIVIVVFLTFTVMISVYTLLPLFEYLIYGEIVPPMRIYFPFMGSNIVVAFVMAFNIWMAFFTFCTICPYSTLLYLIFANMQMVSSIIAGHISDLNEYLVHSKKSLNNTKYRLRSIVLMTMKYNE